MKTFKRIFYCVLCLAFVYSCEYDDTPLNEDIVAQNTGAVLTTISTIGGTINKLNPAESNLESTVLFNDFLNNDTMESVDVYLAFADTTPVNNEVITRDEVLLETIPASNFVIGESGYPENTFAIDGESMLNAVDLDPSLIDGGDLFVLRYNLNLTDGRSFSAADTGGNVRSTSHSSPFRYSSVVVCFKVPEAGDWILDMDDLYGDGWNGGNIVISIDGEETTYACSGFDTTETVTVPVGTSRLLFTYSSGDWEGENLYTFTDPNGVVVLSDGVGDFSQTNGPATGEQFNTCD